MNNKAGIECALDKCYYQLNCLQEYLAELNKELLTIGYLLHTEEQDEPDIHWDGDEDEAG